MPLPFGFTDPGRQATKLIQQEAEGVPVEMIIREGIWNGFDAISRFRHANPDYSGESFIVIKKHHIHTNKMCITNVSGDFFSEEAAINYYATLANSCPENSHVNKNYDETKGRGAKLYFPHAPEGMMIYSKENTEEGHMFHAKLQSDGVYGFSDFEDEVQGKVNFVETTNFSPELKGTVGTDVVLMGATPEQDTWLQLNRAAGNGTGHGSGWPVVHQVSNRLWGPGPVPVKIQIYDSEGLEKSYHTCLDLRSQTKKRKVNGIVELPETEGVPKGTIAHYCYLDKEDSGYYTQEAGMVAFAYKGEVYYNKNNPPQTNRSELSNCGIFANSSKWMVVFEIPSEHHYYSSGDRTHLKGLDKYSFFNAFKENLPKEISTWLDDQIENKIDSTDLNKWLRRELQQFRLPFATIGGSPSPGAKSDSGNNRNSGGRSGTTRKAKQKSSYSKLQNAEVPKITEFCDEESDLIRFSFIDYEMFINKGHKVFKFRSKKFANEFDKITTTEIDIEVMKYIIKSSLYRIFEVQQIHSDMSIPLKQKLWEPNILEALWSVDTDSRIKQTLTKRQNNRSSSFKSA
jgi:hypothetical protein